MISTSMMTSPLDLSQVRRSFPARFTAEGVSRTVIEFRFLSTMMLGALYWVRIIMASEFWTSWALRLER